MSQAWLFLTRPVSFGFEFCTVLLNISRRSWHNPLTKSYDQQLTKTLYKRFARQAHEFASLNARERIIWNISIVIDWLFLNPGIIFLSHVFFFNVQFMTDQISLTFLNNELNWEIRLICLPRDFCNGEYEETFPTFFANKIKWQKEVFWNLGNEIYWSQCCCKNWWIFFESYT